MALGEDCVPAADVLQYKRFMLAWGYLDVTNASLVGAALAGFLMCAIGLLFAFGNRGSRGQTTVFIILSI